MNKPHIEMTGRDLKWLAGIASCIEHQATSMSVLGNVLMESSGDGVLEFQTTNMREHVSGSMRCATGSPFGFTAPVSVLSSIASTLDPEDVVQMTFEGNLRLKAKGSKSDIATIPAEDMPRWPTDDHHTAVTVQCRDFLSALADTVNFTAGEKEPKRVLTGVMMCVEPDAVRFYAANNYMMAVSSIAPIAIEGATGTQASIPRRFAESLRKWLPKEGEVTVAFGELGIMVRRGDVAFRSNKTTPDKMDFTRFMQKVTPFSAEVDREALIGAVARAEAFCETTQSKPNKTAIFEFSPDDGLTIRARADSVGVFSEKIELTTSGLDDAVIVMHILSSLKAILKRLTTDKVAFRWSENKKALWYVEESPRAETPVFLVMHQNVVQPKTAKGE